MDTATRRAASRCWRKPWCLRCERRSSTIGTGAELPLEHHHRAEAMTTQRRRACHSIGNQRRGHSKTFPLPDGRFSLRSVGRAWFPAVTRRCVMPTRAAPVRSFRSGLAVGRGFRSTGNWGRRGDVSQVVLVSFPFYLQDRKITPQPPALLILVNP